MQAQPKTIRDILHTGDQYIIPLFQRSYSWIKKHWEKLRMDVWALMENGANTPLWGEEELWRGGIGGALTRGDAAPSNRSRFN